MRRHRSLALFLLALGLCVGCAKRPRPDILLIVVDTLRADHLGVYGYERPTSPEIDRWAANSVVFESAFASSPWTLPTFGSLLTGRVPAAHQAGRRLSGRPWKSAGLKQRGALDASLPTLAESLQAAGYATGSISSNVFLSLRFGLDRGFETYDNGDGRRAGETVDLALEWIEARAKSGAAAPFFLMVHLMDPHLPYDAPPATAGKFTSEAGQPDLAVQLVARIRRRVHQLGPEAREYLIDRYDEEIAYVDQQIGRLLGALREVLDRENLLVVLTSDHGEELFDHGYFEHGHSVYQEILHVPLIISGPGIEPRRDPVPVSTVDLAPTILEAAGGSVPGPLDGQSLWKRLTRGSSIDDRPLMADQVLYGSDRKALIKWPMKLVIDVGRESRALYDLSSDPEERADLSELEPALADRMEAAIREIEERALNGRQGRVLELDEQTLSKLKALGYID